MNIALLLSGGTGSRIGSGIHKQYIRAGEKMLITYALGTLLMSRWIDKVEIVADPGWQEAILEDAAQAGLDMGKIAGFALPGMTRQASIKSGLEDIVHWRKAREKTKEDGCFSGEGLDGDMVLIHDAARPFLKEELILRCFQEVSDHDGVMPVLPMKDTVYYSESGIRADGLLERSRIYAGQAPELFLLKKYYLANQALSPERLMGISGSAEPAVLAGMDIAMIPGDEGNYKVTTEEDLRRFREQVERGEQDFCVEENRN